MSNQETMESAAREHFAQAREVVVPLGDPATVYRRGVMLRRKRFHRRVGAVAAALIAVAAVGFVVSARVLGTHDQTTVQPDEPVAWSAGTEAWTEVPTGPFWPRTFASVVASDDELLVWGGEATSEADKRNDGAVFNPDSGEWREMAPSPLSPRSEHATVWAGDRMIVCCGQVEDGEPGAAAYFPESDEWETISTSPLSDVEFAGAAWTGKEMIVVGGTRGGGTIPNEEAVAFNPAAGEWRPIAKPPMTIGREPDVVWAGDRLFVLIRDESLDRVVGEVVDRIISYDPSTDQWSFEGGMPTKRGNLVWTGSDLIELGGRTESPEGEFVAARIPYEPGIDGGTGAVFPAFPAPIPPQEPFDGTFGSSSAVWTGTEVVVFTGAIGTGSDLDVPTPVVSFDPDSEIWRQLPALPVQGYNPPMVVVDGTVFVGTDPMMALDMMASDDFAAPEADRSTVVGSLECSTEQEHTQSERLVCPSDAAQAEQELGFDIRVPRTLPTGWSLAHGEIRQYPANRTGAGEAASADYNQAWAPNGILDPVPGVVSPYLQVTQMRLNGYEVRCDEPVILDDGSEACGEVRLSTLGNPGGPTFLAGALEWVTGDGVWIRINSAELTEEELFDAVNSMG
ncbi:MAG: hypothetical protein R3A49_07870 [Acidimicrobiia bacterium]